MPSTFIGGCDCGAIRYECKADPIVAAHCQCRDCQRFSGAGHASMMIVPNEAVALTGEPKFYAKPADSGNMVHRGFCPNCGSSVLGKNRGMPHLLFLTAGSLDDPSLFNPTVAVYTERGHAWDHLDPGLIKFPFMPSAMPGLPNS